MSREWQPGDVAAAEINGKPVRLLRATNVEWVTSEGFVCSARDGLNTRTELVDPRPLVVIDPEDREQVERLVEHYRTHWGKAEKVADALQAALREFANPKMPKPEEPGIWGVVRASCCHSDELLIWTRHEDGNWHSSGDPDDWGSLIDPEVLSEGVQAGEQP